MSGGWTVPDWDCPHAMPVGDLIGHEPDTGCVCVPTLHESKAYLVVLEQEAPVGEVTTGRFWVHHSLDNREASE